MNLKHMRRVAATGLGVLASLGATPSFASTCFTAFNGSTHFQFTQQPTAFTTPGTRAVAGVLFGQLESCAGLARWPIIGAVQVNATSAVLGFRTMTADAVDCGGTDITVNLSPLSLAGPLQSHNDRVNFGNTSTLVPAACINPPTNLVATGVRPRRLGADPLGNGK